jgi:hypothetical protein
MLEKSLQSLIEEHHSLIMSLVKWLDVPEDHYDRSFLRVAMIEKLRKLRNNPYFPDDEPETPSLFGPGKPK